MNAPPNSTRQKNPTVNSARTACHLYVRSPAAQNEPGREPQGEDQEPEEQIGKC